jgi:hypothetical protein
VRVEAAEVKEEDNEEKEERDEKTCEIDVQQARELLILLRGSLAAAVATRGRNREERGKVEVGFDSSPHNTQTNEQNYRNTRRQYQYLSPLFFPLSQTPPFVSSSPFSSSLFAPFALSTERDEALGRPQYNHNAVIYRHNLTPPFLSRSSRRNRPFSTFTPPLVLLVHSPSPSATPIHVLLNSQLPDKRRRRLSSRRHPLVLDSFLSLLSPFSHA